MNSNGNGGFTLPGEAGQEELTLKLAQRWGADMIRDSDGTELSPAITASGYGIYSTLCVIRGHNQWAFEHPGTLQQTFLCTPPAVAVGTQLVIPLLEAFFDRQFRVNSSMDALRYWQVWDRTEGRLLSAEEWYCTADDSAVILSAACSFHSYTVSFLAWRIWEEISMYNHITNHWDTEPLAPLDPVHPAVRQYLLDWLDQWCMQHPDTSVVRFTSLFYNFVWIWGKDVRCRSRFTDWASYDFTVSPRMLDDFAATYGYALTAEDFIQGGRLQPTHRPPTPQKQDYMAFVQQFVATLGQQMVNLIHQYGKQAYLFYDDSWVGTEPYGPYFSCMGFDGLIKCVFNGYEARLCAGAPAPVHELRLHPYLFPVGLGGAPTFSPGGTPDQDARRYWVNVRRALLRQPVDRIGLGGYLHLAAEAPAFCTAIDDILREFRAIQELHQCGAPYTLPYRVAILHVWGKLRSWTLSGHFHETDGFDLIHINEALSGLPLDVRFLDFEDIRGGALQDVDVLINAGPANSAWSGGSAWSDPEIVALITGWVSGGGTLIGVDEPTAAPGGDTRLRLASVFGLEIDDGSRACHSGWQLSCTPVPGLVAPGSELPSRENILLLYDDVCVLAEEEGHPVLTKRYFGQGVAYYLSHFRWSSAAARTLLNLILHARGSSLKQPWTTSNSNCECAFYPASNRAAVVNNSSEAQHTSVYTPKGAYALSLVPFEFRVLPVSFPPLEVSEKQLEF